MSLSDTPELLCRVCKTKKEISQFYFNPVHARVYPSRRTCRSCEAEIRKNKYTPEKAKAAHDSYLRERVTKLEKSAAKRSARKLILLTETGGACHVCKLRVGAEWPVDCFDFHHVDPEQKDGIVARLLHRRDLNAARAEAKKCVVLCANCHRRIHHRVTYEST